MVSCNEDKSQIVVDEIDSTFDFTFSKVIRNNILVNDRVEVEELSINSKSSIKNTIFRMYTVGISQSKHQLINEDFNFGELEEKMKIMLRHRGFLGFDRDTIYYKDVSTKKIVDIFNKDSVPNIYIKPLQPGLFRLNLAMQRFDTIKKEFVGKPVVKRISFNVVDIYLRFTSNKSSDGQVLNKWEISFQNGIQPYDKYLSLNDNIEGYEMDYDFDGESGKNTYINPDNGWNVFCSNNKSYKTEIYNYFSDLKISLKQKFKNGKVNVIKYNLNKSRNYEKN